MATTPVYARRGRVLNAANFGKGRTSQVDAAIAAASRTIEGQTHRRFYPTLATRYFDWPGRQPRRWALDLNGSEIVSLSSLTIAGTAQDTTDFFLEPINDGPPYHTIEIDLADDAAFTAGSTHQRAIAVTGVFGYDNVTAAAGTTAETLDTSETEVTVTNGGLVDVWDLLTLDSERMLVTDVTFVDSTTELDDAVSESVADKSIPVADESGFIAGETIRVNSEQMRVEDADTAGTLNVERAVNGTTLAAHVSTDTVFVDRSLTVERNATGTTAANHVNPTTIYRQVYPSLIEQWCVAEALAELEQTGAAYARTAGSGDNEREVAGRALADIRKRAMAVYGRVRVGVV